MRILSVEKSETPVKPSAVRSREYTPPERPSPALIFQYPLTPQFTIVVPASFSGRPISPGSCPMKFTSRVPPVVGGIVKLRFAGR